MVYIQNGNIYRYKGEIDAEEIESWITLKKYLAEHNALLHKNVEEFFTQA